MRILQDHRARGQRLDRAVAVLKNTRLAAAWRAWRDLADDRAQLQAGLQAAVNMVAHRCTALAMQAWKVILNCDPIVLVPSRRKRVEEPTMLA